MVEQELRRALGGVLRRRLAGGDPVLVQAPHRRQRLVERGAVAGGLLVAVPAAVRPLPLDERLREQPDARVVGKPEPAADRERVPLLRAAPPHEAVDRADPGPVALAGEPREHGVGRGDAAGLAGRDAELDERDEPPVRAAPFAVDVDAEAAVGAAAPRAAPRTSGPSRTRAASGGSASPSRSRLAWKTIPGSSESSSQSRAEAVTVMSARLRGGRAAGRRARRRRRRASTRA